MKQETSINLSALIDLVHHRWNIPIIAQIHARSGAKFVALANSLPISRSALSASLHDLIALGIVARNEGHGHPMRPEYILTTVGEQLGADCEELVRVVTRRHADDIAFRKWTLPIVAAIGDQAVRFNEVRSALENASPRAITLTIKTLLSRKWITRNIIDDYPPAAGYQLMATGRRILTCVEDLAVSASRIICIAR